MSEPEYVQEPIEEEEEEPEEEDVAENKNKEAVLYPKVPEGVYREREALIKFENLDYDWDATMGQARPMQKNTRQERLREMEEAMATTFLRVTVWPSDMHGKKSRVFKYSYHFLFPRPKIFGSLWTTFLSGIADIEGALAADQG